MGVSVFRGLLLEWLPDSVRQQEWKQVRASKQRKASRSAKHSVLLSRVSTCSDAWVASFGYRLSRVFHRCFLTLFLPSFR